MNTTISKKLKNLTRRDIENYLIDSLGWSEQDFEVYTKEELIDMLREAGELRMCIDYAL